MSNVRLVELTTKSLSGEASPGELKELETLLATDAKAMARYRMLQQFWNQHEAISQPAVEEALQKLFGQMGLTPTDAQQEEAPVVPMRTKWWKRVAVAAAAIIVASTAYWYIARNDKDPSKDSLVEKHNARGTKSTIELTDGSKIWLNADSKIKYPSVFAGNTREVYLNGEAFFEVAKNPSKPFIIHLANGTVRVLGTSFNIRAYDNEKVVETSVATGKVAFIPKYQAKLQKQDTLFITPNNKVRYLLKEDLANVVTTIAAEDKAWTEGRLIFRGITFDEIAIELERYFGKEVRFVDEEMKSKRLTGSFQNNSLDEIMFYLSKSTDFNYKITNSELLIGRVDSTLE
jgi:transmembrane sensor